MAAAEEWSRWVVFFGLGGFVGNFALSLCDHAQNNFFVMTEWIPSVSSAVAIGFLAVAVTASERRYLHLCLAIMGLQSWWVWWASTFTCELI